MSHEWCLLYKPNFAIHGFYELTFLMAQHICLLINVFGSGSNCIFNAFSFWTCADPERGEQGAGPPPEKSQSYRVS